jgi:hypothetical protein
MIRRYWRPCLKSCHVFHAQRVETVCMHSACRYTMFQSRHAMSPVMPCVKACHVSRHAMSQVMPCLKACHVSRHAMSQGMPCLKACHVSRHAMSQGIPCLKTCHVSRHAMSQGMPCLETCARLDGAMMMEGSVSVSPASLSRMTVSVSHDSLCLT